MMTIRECLRVFALAASVVGFATAAQAQQTNYLGTVFIADPTTPTQQLKVNADGSINATVTGGGGGITVGAAITGTCPSGDVIFNNAGVIGCEALAGGGNVLSSGTPTNGQLAVWTNATTIQGLTTLPTAAFPALTGDVTTTAGALATTLATVNTNTGSFGSSTSIPNFTVNGKGLITAAGSNVVIAPAGTLTGATLASNVLASSLTSVGTLSSLTVSGAITATGLSAGTQVSCVGLDSGNHFVLLASACGSGGGGAVSSVFGRTGAVVAATNDYSFSQISGNYTLAQGPTIGANTVLGSIAGGTPAALTQTQLTSLVNVVTTSLSGAAPTLPNDGTKFLNGVGSYITAVTQITFGNGTNAVVCNTTCIVNVAEAINSLTSANPPILTTAWGEFSNLNNAGAQTPTIAQAGTTGFPAGSFFDIGNTGAGVQTLTPGGGTVGGASTLVFPAGSATTPRFARLTSDGSSNYQIVFSTLTFTTGPSSSTSGDLPSFNGTTGLALQDSGVAVANVVTLAGVQSLTNKTLSSTTDVIGGVTMTLSSDATGDIYYRNSSGVLTRLGIGSGTQVLGISAGLPAWVASGGGSSTITAGTTATSGITTGNLIGSTSNLVVDSGVPFANFPVSGTTNGHTVQFSNTTGTLADSGIVAAQMALLGTNTGNTSGHVVTMANTTTGIQDSGTALSALAPLASPNFTGTVGAAALTMTGIFSNSQAGALSASAVNITGAPITSGGSGTTTFPLVYINSGAAPTTFVTGGTILGINTPTGFAGDFFDTHVNGGTSLVSIAAINSGSAVITNAANTPNSTNLLSIRNISTNASGAGVFQFGNGSNNGEVTVTLNGSANTTVGAGQNGTSSFTINNIEATNTGGIYFQTQGTNALTISKAQLVAVPAITTDAALTDTTVCQDTTAHGLHAGSGTAGICLGNVSSMRFKHDWNDITNGLTILAGLNPGTYRYNEGVVDGGARIQYGFKAEDYARVLPVLTRYDAEGRPNGVDMMGLVPVLAGAVKQIDGENQKRDDKIARLQEEIEELKRGAR